jgi:hypothetical protein
VRFQLVMMHICLVFFHFIDNVNSASLKLKHIMGNGIKYGINKVTPFGKMNSAATFWASMQQLY